MSGSTEIILCGVFMGVLWILARRIGYRKGFREGFKYGYFCMKGIRKSRESHEKDTPQTEQIKTLDYCDMCNHKGCENCIANSLDDYCVPSGYEPTTQTETQNSNLTFEIDTPQTEAPRQMRTFYEGEIDCTPQNERSE